MVFLVMALGNFEALVRKRAFFSSVHDERCTIGNPLTTIHPQDTPGAITMLLDELHAKRDAIQTLSRRYGARRIRVFGSVARREERADSDVDFLVDFPRGYDLFAQRMPLTDQLAQLLKRPVELIPEHELNRHIREQVLREVVEL
jgi:uncharacterized protein